MTSALHEHEEGPSPSPPTDSQPLPTTVEAPPMTSKVFPSWDAFAAYMADYQRQTFQMFRSKSTMSVAARNQRAVAPKGTESMPNPTAHNRRAIPTEVGFYSKLLVCTHSGKPRIRGQGIRPRQCHRATDCPAKINALAKRKYGCDRSKASGWQIVVTKLVTSHNHPLDAETFMSYPQNRKVEDPMVLEAVDALRKAGVKRKQIRKYIEEKEPNKQLTTSDISNLLTKLKDDERTTAKSTQAKAGPAPPGAASSVDQASADGSRVVNGRAEEPGDADAGELRVARATVGSFPGGLLNGSQNPEVHERTAIPESARGGTNATNTDSLRLSCEADEDFGEDYKMRLKRLDEQNLALYKQNSMLHKLNQEYVADLKKTRNQVVSLQKSEAKLADKVKQLSREVERLKAQNVNHPSGQLSKRPHSSNESSRPRKR